MLRVAWAGVKRWLLTSLQPDGEIHLQEGAGGAVSHQPRTASEEQDHIRAGLHLPSPGNTEKLELHFLHDGLFSFSIEVKFS